MHAHNMPRRCKKTLNPISPTPVSIDANVGYVCRLDVKAMLLAGRTPPRRSYAAAAKIIHFTLMDRVCLVAHEHRTMASACQTGPALRPIDMVCTRISTCHSCCYRIPPAPHTTPAVRRSVMLKRTFHMGVRKRQLTCLLRAAVDESTAASPRE